LIENLAIDLSVERRDLYRIVQFYRFYEIVSALSTQLSWGHFLELIVVEDTHRRAFYQNKAVFHSWSVRELRKQIKANLYGNTPPKDIEAAFQTKLPAVEPSKVFKNTYDFNFIELSHNEGEKDLENLIMKHFEHFLKEMGEDFAIIGRQVPLKIDGETHFIDIVLYNRAIPCVVAYNLFVLFKISALSNDWRHAQVHSLRWRLYNEAGKVVRHGRRLILKVSAWIHEMLADIRIRSKELACSYC
jgi:predicted nuclease of restriction endonuclease-like (RecB) superfamily